MVVPNNGVATIDDATGDEDGHRPYASNLVYKTLGFAPCYALRAIFHICQQTSLGIVRHTQMGHHKHLTHTADCSLIGSSIQLAVVTHDRININLCAEDDLLTTVFCDNLRLALRCQEARHYSIETETQLVPFLRCLTNIVGTFKYGKFSIREGIGDKHSGKIEHIVSHI